MSLKIAGFDVAQCAPASPEAPSSHYDGCKPGTTTFPAGFQKTPEHRTFPVSTIFERDIEVPLRDGTKLRADVFRPAVSAPKLPALVAWSPYGKSGTDLVPGRVGVPQSRLSGFENFEAPDPAEWTARGYAIVNVNSRGAFDSEGDVRWFGTAEGRDGYDAIEYIAGLPWCSGKVSLVGNSWLGASQWYIAAENPPHLACIAPLEGFSDLYREILCRGGVPYTPFFRFLGTLGIIGRNQQEDVLAMIQKHPLMNAYWEDKRAKPQQIKIPAYILASYSSFLHTVGSFRMFEDLESTDKWLRVHPTQEWHDLYSSECVNDLQLFFDHFLKGEQNNWRDTPRVRMSLLRYNEEPELNRRFDNWPVPSTDYRPLYLSGDRRLTESAPSQAATLSYQSDVPALQVDADPEELTFEYTFSHRSNLVGYSKAVLYMSCPDADDLDVFVQLRKADVDGNILQNINIPLRDLQLKASEVVSVNTNKYLGPSGVLRASHRAIDAERSKPHWALHSHLEEEKVPAGTVVKLEIGIWPSGIVFQPGERLVLKIAGHQMVLAEFEPLRGEFVANNKGRHVVHMGQDYPSHVVIPFVTI
ncbi:hypothetical protein SEUCBS139899_004548 [Sporothrix eucalyptigena]